MWRFAEHGAKAAAEMRLGHVRDRGHGGDVERFGKGAVHGIAGAQQAPIEVLDFQAHGATLRHPRGTCAQPDYPSPAMPTSRRATQAKRISDVGRRCYSGDFDDLHTERGLWTA